MTSVWERIRQRKLVQWAIAYLAGAWVVFQLVAELGGRWSWPAGLQRAIDVMLVAGFSITLVLAWYHGEKGRQRVSGPELLMVAALLVLAGSALTLVRGTDDTGPAVRGEEPAADSPGDPAARSIAVLPLDNLSPEGEAFEWFVDGLHAEIIAQLSKIQSLHVISRTSVLRYKERDDRSLRQIGAELGAATVVEATVRRSGDRLRITANLIDVESDLPLWSDTYDRELTDVFTIQSDVALNIAAALGAELSGSELERIESRPTDDPEAYDLYLKGLHALNRWTAEGTREALELFLEASEKHPDFVLAHVGLAGVYSRLACCSTMMGDVPPAEYYRQARRAAQRALQINPNARVHDSLGWVAWGLDFDWAAAENYFRRAIDLRPSDGWAHTRYAIMLLARGRYEEALERTSLAEKLDPLSEVIAQDLAQVFLYAGRYGEAEKQAQKAIELAPNSPVVYKTLAEVYLAQGRYEEAIANFRRVIDMSPRGSEPLSRLAYTYAVSGDTVRAAEVLSELQRRSEEGYVSPVSMAIVYAGLGEPDQAIDWLETAFATGAGWIALARTPVEFEGLRDHPRFIALLNGIGLGDRAAAGG